jgi:hypothetical protein
MIEKKLQISGVLILGILLLLVIKGCGSVKYSADFKSQKKHLDTLSVFTPIVTVIADNKKLKYTDTSLSNSIRLLIEKQIFDLLSEKYRLEKKQLPKTELSLFDDTYSQLENSDKRLNGIFCDSILEKFDVNYESRFVLLITFKGEINPDYGPHYNLKAGMATNRIIIAPHTKAYSDLRLTVIDTKTNEIVFYDKIKTSNYDPRMESEIEHITKTILKKIYYK